MPSPDFSNYIDFTTDERSVEEMYDSAVEYARIAMPEFSPRVGTIEDSILQACALLAHSNVSTLNRIPDGLMEGILRLMGLERNEATFSTVDVEFTVATAGDVVPLDFGVSYEVVIGDSLVQYPFLTTSAIVSESGTVAATLRSTISGVIPSIPIGTQLNIVQPNSTVLFCETTDNVQQGSEPETDEEYFARGTTYLASLSTSLVTAQQIEQFIVSNFPDAHRCRVYDLTYFPTATGTIQNGVAEATCTATTSFVTDSTFTDYTRIINRATSAGGIASIESGLYDTTASSASEFTFTPSGTTLVDVDADFIDMYKLRTDYTGQTSGAFAIFVCAEDGSALSASTKTDIYNAVAERIVAGLYFVVVDALICDVEFSIDISVDPEYSATSIVATVADEIESYVSPANWAEWGSTIRVFDVVVRASNIPGVAYVNSVTAGIVTYDGVVQAQPGNQYALTATDPGGGVTAINMVYHGSLPRSTVGVTVS